MTDEEVLKSAQESGMDVYDRFLMQQLRAKKLVTFSPDSYSYAYLCYLKVNVNKYQLDRVFISRNLHFSLVIFLVQITMMVCMVFENISQGLSPGFDTNNKFPVLIARFACSVALHLKFIPDFAKGMKLINFVNNNPELFLSSRIAYLIGFMQIVIAFLGECLNLYNLQCYEEVHSCMIHFVTLLIICELNTIYFGAQIDNKLGK